MHALRLVSCLVLVGVTVVSLTFTLPPLAAQPPSTAAETITITGDYWALIIGISKYEHMRELKTPVDDARAVRDVLVQRYGFKTNRVMLLTAQQETTRTAIENAFQALTKSSGPGPNDSLLIYYAGHGQIDQDGTQGYWVPSDGKEQQAGTLVHNAIVQANIRAMKAKHVLLVADTCFAGSLLDTENRGGRIYDTYYGGRYRLASRRVMVSGAREPVSDAGSKGHSAFAYQFLKELQENKQSYLVPSDFFNRVAKGVHYNSPQQPQYEPLHMAGHKDGEFVFQLAGVEAPPPPPPPSLILESRGGSSTGHVPPIQEARAPTFGAPTKLQKEIKGNDGAPMVLVPAGEFMMGNEIGFPDEKPIHPVYLPSYYIDKYEVTFSLFDMYQGNAERKRPHWSEYKSKHKANEPVEADWFDAWFYCNSYGKRLPTEAEWEKAARGTDGRVYPWGNTPPDSILANVNKSCPRLFGCAAYQYEYTINAAPGEVGSNKADTSPYGVHDMAGSVTEWVSDNYSSSYYESSPRENPQGVSPQDSTLKKVIRPGNENMRSTSKHWDDKLFHYGFRCAMDAPK